MRRRLGIPLSIYFNDYIYFCQEFFSYLGFDLIISSNKSYICFNSNICPALKSYLMNIEYLKDKCDYILIPNIIKTKNNCENCSNITNLYNITKSLFDIKIISYNIHINDYNRELSNLLKLSKQFKIDKKYLIESFYKARKKNILYKKQNHEENIIKLYTNKIKVLVVGYSYLIHNKYLMMDLLKVLNNEKYEIIYGDNFNGEITANFSTKYIHSLNSEIEKSMIGSIDISKSRIDGIIFISTIYCVSNTVISEFIKKNINKPYINIKIEDPDKLIKFNKFIKYLERKDIYAR